MRLRKVLLVVLYLIPALVGLFVDYVGLLALAVFLVMTYQMWKSIEGQGARTAPGRAVGYQFIPVYGVYWMFHVYPGFATDFNKRASDLVASTGKSAPKFSRSLMVARCVFFMLSVGANRLANEPSFQESGPIGVWAVLISVCLTAIVLDAVVINKVSDAVNWLADASVASAPEPASTTASVGKAVTVSESASRHSKLAVASSVSALLMLAAFVIMLASRGPAGGAGVDLSIASLSTVNGVATLLTSLLGVAASVLAIVAFGRRNSRKVFATIGLSGSLVLMTVTAALMVSSESGTASWSEGSPKPRSTANYPRLFPMVENGKWGFVDVAGRVVIEPQYDYARRFSEGLAAVNVGGVCKDAAAIGGKWGFIDTTGAFFINPQYDDVNDYAERLVCVRSGLDCAFLDTLGDTVFTVSPDRLNALLATAADNARHVEGLVQSEGFSQGLVPYAPAFDPRTQAAAELRGLRAGVAPTSRPDWSPTGYLAQDGHVAIRPTFSEVAEFSEGLAAVRYGLPTGKWGYINRRGRWVIRPQFDNAGPFSEGLAAVEVGVTPIRGFDQLPATLPTSPEACIERPGKWGYVDRRGRLVINPQFDDAEQFTEGLAAVRLGGKWDTTLRHTLGGKWGFIDHRGAYTIRPQYDWAKAFASGRAQVTVADKSGYIDKRGMFVVQPQYSVALSYRDGLAIVVTGEPRTRFDDLDIIFYGGPPTPDCRPWAYIDTLGRIVWKSAGWPQSVLP